MVQFETTTPTGAAILAANVQEFTPKVDFKLKKIAYGIGHRDLEIPNVLRVYLGEKDSSEKLGKQYTLETNIQMIWINITWIRGGNKMINNEKYNELIKYLKSLGKVVLAFRVEQIVLFYLKQQKKHFLIIKAVTILSPYIPKWEIAEAERLVKKLGVKHEIIKAQLLIQLDTTQKIGVIFTKTAVFNMILDLAKNKDMIA